MVNRENLINQLAASMGMGALDQTNYESSRYDAKTGTLYCKGMAISKNTANKAVGYFESMERKCDSENPTGREMMMIYRCAIEAIKMMQTEKIKDLMKDEASRG